MADFPSLAHRWLHLDLLPAFTRHDGARCRCNFALKVTMSMVIPMLIVLLAVIVFPETAVFLLRIFSPEMIN